MKISELVDKLNALKEEHGDIRTVMETGTDRISYYEDIGCVHKDKIYDTGEDIIALDF